MSMLTFTLWHIAIACNVKLRWKVDMDQLRKRLFLRLGALQLRSWAAESELLDEPQLAARSPWAYGTLQRDSNHWRRLLVQNSAAREHTNWSRWLKEPALLEPSWCGSRGRRIERPVNSVGQSASLINLKSAVRARHWLFFLLWRSLLALLFQRIKFQLLNRTWCREMTS